MVSMQTCSLSRNRGGLFLRQIVPLFLAVLCQLGSSALASENSTCNEKMVIRLGLDGRSQSGTSFDQSFDQMREFLWAHWNSKNCADLILSTVSKEGIKSDSHLKIERTQNDQMVLTTTSTSYGGFEPPNAPPDKTPRTHSSEAYEIKRVKTKSVFRKQVAPPAIPENETLPSSEYRLQFKDRQGEVIAYF